MRVDVKLTSKSRDGEVGTTTISYVNPDATNADLVLLAKQLNQLTSNTYVSSTKISTINLDEEEVNDNG